MEFRVIGKQYGLYLILRSLRHIKAMYNISAKLHYKIFGIPNIMK